MAIDATGTPTTNFAIPKINPAVDAPSGNGTNAAMDTIDAALLTVQQGAVTKPAGTASGEVPVWNGTTWVRSSATNVAPTSLGSGTPDATKFLRGDGAWQVVSTGLPGAVLYDSGPIGAATAVLDSGAGGFATTFRNLRIIVSAKSDDVTVNTSALLLRFNNDSGANYDYVSTRSNGSTGVVDTPQGSALSGIVPSSHFPNSGSSTNASNFGSAVFDVFDYGATTHHKKALYRADGIYDSHNTGRSWTYVGSGLWASTAAINRVQISMGLGNVAIGSRVIVIGEG